MREGIIVTLGGSRSGAEIAARDNGIELWGPDELEQHLGQLAVAALRTGPLRRESTGFPRRATSAEVESFLAGATRGRLGSAKEEIVWASDAWLPVAYLRIALSRMEGVLKKTMQTTRCWNTYELVTGEIIRAWDAEIAAEPVDLDAQQVTAKLKVNQPGFDRRGGREASLCHVGCGTRASRCARPGPGRATRPPGGGRIVDQRRVPGSRCDRSATRLGAADRDRRVRTPSTRTTLPLPLAARRLDPRLALRMNVGHPHVDQKGQLPSSVDINADPAAAAAFVAPDEIAWCARAFNVWM